MAYREGQPQTTTADQELEFVVATDEKFATVAELRKQISEATYSDEEWESKGLDTFEKILKHYFELAAIEIENSYHPSQADDYTRNVQNKLSDRALDLEALAEKIPGFGYEDLAQVGIVLRWLETIQNTDPNSGINRYRLYLLGNKPYLDPGTKDRYLNPEKRFKIYKE